MIEIVKALAFSLLWPAAAAVSLGVAVGKENVTAWGLLLLACGTAAAYGVDRLIDSRGTDSKPVRIALQCAILTCAVFGAVLACTAWWRFEVCLALGLLAGFYVPLKKVLPKNYIVMPAWTIAVGCLPFAESPQFDARHFAGLGAIALIMLANTMLCDVGSVEDDRRHRVKSLSVWLGAKPAAMVAGLIALAGTVSAASHHHWGLAVTAYQMSLVAVWLWITPKSRNGHFAADLVLVLFPGPVAMLFG